jgi:hypothetical protein
MVLDYDDIKKTLSTYGRFYFDPSEYDKDALRKLLTIARSNADNDVIEALFIEICHRFFDLKYLTGHLLNLGNSYLQHPRFEWRCDLNGDEEVVREMNETLKRDDIRAYCLDPRVNELWICTESYAFGLGATYEKVEFNDENVQGKSD